MGTMLRNTDEVNFKIKGQEGETLRRLDSYYNVRKITRMARGVTPFTFFNNALWDGTLDGKPIADGQKVFYEAEFIRDSNSEPQYLSFPVVGDATGPVLSNVNYDDETGNLKWTSYDHVS